jgi:hypothetical protein
MQEISDVFGLTKVKFSRGAGRLNAQEKCKAAQVLEWKLLLELVNDAVDN